MIGGHPYYPTLLPRDYDVAKSTLKINIRTGKMVQKNDLVTGRFSFGICTIGEYIYAIAGYNSDSEVL